MLIPSIDLMNGKAVQLRQGREKVLERDDVLQLARYFALFGEVAVIDLDAALNQGDNEELIKEICKIAPTRVGGGIRDVEKAKRILANGAKKIIIGTAANEEFLSKLPKDKVIVAIDEKNGKIATDGWQNTNNFSPLDYIKRFDNLCSGYLYTVVENEGMMQGCNLKKIQLVRAATNLDITAAGGISTIEEIKELEKINVSSQLGMSIYTGAIKLEDAFINNLNFEKQQGLIPTIVQDYETKQVLMLAYSTPESLKMTFQKGLATYFSRSRNELWTKGETSGNFLNVVKLRADCDRDCVLATVLPTGPSCHTGSWTCFGTDPDEKSSMGRLYNIIADRFANPKPGSYTATLDAKRVREKVEEEAEELCEAETKEDVIWEAADLLYFVNVLLYKEGVTWQDVYNELDKRHKK